MIYAVIVAGISLVFAGLVLRQYLSRRQPYQLIWSVALAMSFAASAAYAGAAVLDSPGFFKAYYLLGALLMAAYLGQGSIYLVVRRRLADAAMVILLVLSAVGMLLMLRAPVDTAAVAALAGGPGVDVIEIGTPLLLLLIVLNTYGVAAVAGAALYSIWGYRQRGSDLRFVGGNAGIAVGAVLNGLAGTLARWGGHTAAWFWLTMAVGWLVIFVGFLLINTAAGKAPHKGQGQAASHPSGAG